MNRLADERSLYLRQHADNPVDWYPWGEEALSRAREEDRPILLSIGYSSCHWCHVMAHESFEDPDVAAVMNELFVNVKVDREERPDVDALYMQATIAMAGHGGWPMTVFLTPEGEPFYAGTYFPKTARGGMPAFPDVLRAVADAFRGRRDDVRRTAEQLGEGLRRQASRRPSDAPITQALVDDAMVGLARAFDPHQGGFGGAPKFPPHLALELLLTRAWRRPDERHPREMAELTLTRMAEGGIHDQVGGGFHRYSVDDVWLVPHFEKMLYDNALLARVYALAHRVTGDDVYADVSQTTLDYLLREMRTPDGGFAAAQDADSPGGEGAFFVWTPDELRRVLTAEEARAVEVRFGVTAQGNFEGATILHVAAPMQAVAREVGPDAPLLLHAARGKLSAARSRRPAPARDGKVLAAWNGLTIAALADAGLILGRPDYLDAAREAADLVLGSMVLDGRLMRTLVDGEARHLGMLDDHADVCHGLLRLYAADLDPRWVGAARELAARMVVLFHDPVDGGFFLSPSDGERLVARTRDVEDHPTPAGNSQAAWVLLRLAALTGETRLEDLALGALAGVRDEMGRWPQAFGTALLAADAHTSLPREVAVIGAPDDPRTAALVATARREGGPYLTLAACAPEEVGAASAVVPLLAGRAPVDGAPAAYVCRRFTCLAPVTTPGDLAAQLSS